MRRLLRMMALVLMVSGATGVSTAMVAPAAQAAGTARLEAHQYLLFPSNNNYPASCHHRTIRLATGDYIWATTHPGGGSWERRSMRLAAGDYVWQNCLIPTGSTSYEQTASLAAVGRPDLPRATLFSLFDSRTSGWYTWGSILIPD